MKNQVLLISTKDSVADEFGPVGMANTEESAVRQFGFQMMKMVESPSLRSDYDLYVLGVMNCSTGIIDSSEMYPYLLKSGKDYLPVEVKTDE